MTKTFSFFYVAKCNLPTRIIVIILYIFISFELKKINNNVFVQHLGKAHISDGRGTFLKQHSFCPEQRNMLHNLD